MPKISVIVPVYNTELYLKECIDSILSQSFDDFELIAIDDGSTDKSRDILEEYKASDPRVKILDGGHNGAPHARNIAFEIASGEFCYFFDSDDYMVPGALQKMVDASIDENMVIGRFELLENGVIRKWQTIGRCGKIKTDSEENYKELMVSCWPNPINKMIRTSWLLEHHLHWLDLKIAQDLNFYQKIYSQIDSVKVIDDVVSVYRVATPNCISTRCDKSILDVKRAVDDVDVFAQECGASEAFKNTFEIIKLVYYSLQINKCKGMNYRDAKDVGEKLYKYAKGTKCNDKDKYIKELHKSILCEYLGYCTIIRFVYVPLKKLKYINLKNIH